MAEAKATQEKAATPARPIRTSKKAAEKIPGTLPDMVRAQTKEGKVLQHKVPRSWIARFENLELAPSETEKDK